MTLIVPDAAQAADQVIATVGTDVVIGLPIGLAKPVHLINALYERAVADPSISLKIVTGLSIGRPRPKNDVERRFIDPIIDRLFKDTPDSLHAEAFAQNTLPPNVQVVEFYMKAGAFLNNPAAQHSYISTNYSHVGRDMLLQGVNVFAQAISKRGEGDDARYSLSSNSDSLSLFPGLRAAEEAGRPMLLIGQVNRKLPFMPRDAEVTADTFDLLIDNPALDHAAFAAPSPPVADAEHMIGLRASALIKDGGTLQIGIGSLGDAIAYACGLRHRDNATWNEVLDTTGIASRDADAIAAMGGTGPFERGLYGSTEMFADCFRTLYQDGVLSRVVYDELTLQRISDTHDLKPDQTDRAFDLMCESGALSALLSIDDVDLLKRCGVFHEAVTMRGGVLFAPDGSEHSVDIRSADARADIAASCLGPRLKTATVLHAGFFLGPQRMYDMLTSLPEDELDLFCMTGIGYVNQLYGNEPLASLQRRNARFINTAMMMSLLGAACSDALETGQVVSGVGGQYNFVSMAHALDAARSILMLRSTRTKNGKASSNLLWNYGHTTIPRHLRDVVITEYGVADLRGRQDHEVIEAMIGLADAQFQEELRTQAVNAGKLSPDWQIPDAVRSNTAERITADLKRYKARGLFSTFPVGSDLTDEELVLSKALKGLQSRMHGFGGSIGLVAQAVTSDIPAAAEPYLERMKLSDPSSLEEEMLRRILARTLQEQGAV